ncbi:MAG: SAM-dependent chlorinase/fluorinase [candidate division Zixibacteria bacterium]|nr:SAM-dependent chlorinase/fluorinase [candidate division Zixibacteria bacterium]
MITFSSDFDAVDPYAAIVKGVILSINPKAKIIDLSHELAPHDIRPAAFFVAAACPVFPSRTIHLCVVDPGVGSNRKPILIATERGFFVGPDNGIFSLIWQKSERRKAYWLKNRKYHFRGTSQTFDARDIFGPTAAHLSLGLAPEEFGPLLRSIKMLPFPEPVERPAVRGKRFTGEIIYIDRFGNLITNFPYRLVQGKHMDIKVGGRTMSNLAPNYTAIPKGKTAPILGSLGYLEIAGNAESAQKLLKAKIGTKVELTLL